MKTFLVLVGLVQLVCSNHLFAFPIEIADSPDNDLALTLSAIQSAKQTLQINIYELSSPEIADAIIAQVNAGISVEIIQEGQPVGGMAAAAKGIQSEIAQAMQSVSRHDHLFVMTSKAGGKRRFHYDHAKYVVIDGQDLLIGSENYSPTGNPKPGTLGNRGWEVLIHDSATAQQFQAIFQADSDMSSHDLVDLVNSSAVREAWFPHVQSTDAAPATFSTLNADSAEIVTSPNSSLTGLLALINGAQTTLDIEQMTFDSLWKGNGAVNSNDGSGGGDGILDFLARKPGSVAKPPAGTSPLLTAVIEAAHRGVHVRVLLNDERVFAHAGHSSRSINPVTVQALNDAAQKNGYPIEARVANIKAMHVDYIHNKGVLVDGDKTLVSSINWGANAVLNNREAAVVLHSREVNSYYQNLFNQDWQNSATSSGVEELAASAALAPLGSTEAEFKCPSFLHLTARIGTLVSPDTSDDSFKSISNRTLSVDLYHAQGSSSCVMVQQAKLGSDSVAKQLYLQIRKRVDGTRTIALEGYTPKSQLFSIRTLLQDGETLLGAYTAFVYDGSGPSRDKLGNADLLLSNER